MSLISIPGKILRQILLERIKTKTRAFSERAYLDLDQTGERFMMQFLSYVKFCKAKERNVDIHLNFIDYEVSVRYHLKECIME